MTDPGGFRKPAEVISHRTSFKGRLPSLTDTVGLPTLLPKRVAQPHARLAPVPPIRKLVVPGQTKFYLDGQLIKEYDICGRPFMMQQPPNEGVATFTRQTINGRTLSYRLKVVQQPEKARACGSGPRSSADRRPVDPPPVVKLTIFEGNEDITLRYDAGFMLYASLDVARPIANGRMHAAPIVPVLTGVAVAGVAYLERPKQAGYFIFPDLSVRHEGWYRLRFHLFEQVKHSEDADKDRPFEQSHHSTSEQPREPNSHEAMANRMFVFSCPFQVFSAKKFPGLNTSTELSKVVADQGCRVRIRREIRQRRKPKGKDEDESDRRSSHATPEPLMRPLHERNMSLDGSDISRRMSIDTTQPQILSRKPSAEQLVSSTPIMGAPARPQVLTSSPISATFPQDSRLMYLSESDSKVLGPSTNPLTGLPRTITPTRDLGTVTLPPIASLYGANAASPRPRQYNLPDPTPQKRSYSPKSYSSDIALKDGARPDTMLPPSQGLPPSRQRSTSSINFVMNPEKSQPIIPQPSVHAGPVIEADDDPDGVDSDSDCSILDGPFVYRRADGTKSARLIVSR